VWNWRDGQSGRGDYDLPATDVLNVAAARDENAEKHLCPMPLNITRRALDLWSNEGDVVLSPFAGVGSEGVAAIGKGRRFVGTELNPPYFAQAVKNLTASHRDTADLFTVAA
jgi:DNA modification methylase